MAKEAAGSQQFAIRSRCQKEVSAGQPDDECLGTNSPCTISNIDGALPFQRASYGKCHPGTPLSRRELLAIPLGIPEADVEEEAEDIPDPEEVADMPAVEDIKEDKEEADSTGSEVGAEETERGRFGGPELMGPERMNVGEPPFASED